MKRNICNGLQEKRLRDAALCYGRDVFQKEGMMFKLEFFNLNAVYT